MSMRPYTPGWLICTDTPTSAATAGTQNGITVNTAAAANTLLIIWSLKWQSALNGCKRPGVVRVWAGSPGQSQALAAAAMTGTAGLQRRIDA